MAERIGATIDLFLFLRRTIEKSSRTLEPWMHLTPVWNSNDVGG